MTVFVNLTVFELLIEKCARNLSKIEFGDAILSIALQIEALAKKIESRKMDENVFNRKYYTTFSSKTNGFRDICKNR